MGSDRYDDRIAWKYYITYREREERRRARSERGHIEEWENDDGEKKKRERARECRMIAMQEEREQKVFFHGVSNRGTWRCTFRDLCAHLTSGPSTSSVALSRTTAWQRRTPSSYPLRWCLPAKATKKRRDSGESIRIELHTTGSDYYFFVDE